MLRGDIGSDLRCHEKQGLRSHQPRLFVWHRTEKTRRHQTVIPVLVCQLSGERLCEMTILAILSNQSNRRSTRDREGSAASPNLLLPAPYLPETLIFSPRADWFQGRCR